MLTWKRTKRPLGDLKRPKKSRRRLFWTILGPKSKSRGAQERPKIGPKRKKTSATIDGIDLFLFLLLLRVQEANLVDLGSIFRSIWGRCWVDVGSIWGRFGVDLGSILNYIESILSRYVGLSVCLSAIQTSRDHCQTARPGGLREAIK